MEHLLNAAYSAASVSSPLVDVTSAHPEAEGGWFNVDAA